MPSNRSDLHFWPIYKLFFDDIEEIFLNTISFRVLILLTSLTIVFSLGIFILLFYRSTTIFTTCLVPFVYALVLYDLIQLFSLVILKYNLTERFSSRFCRWPYYLKSSSEAGQCLTLIFLFVLIRHQLRYFHTHHHLLNSDRIHSRALTFVCLLFIIYVNNWITHLKVEKFHLVTLNTTEYEIKIEELPISFYELSDVRMPSHQRFILDLEKYSQGSEKPRHDHREPSSKPTDQIYHNHQDGSIHEIVIKFPQLHLFNSAATNRTKRKSKVTKRHLFSNESTEQPNNSYRINRCTYGQSNFFLANLLSLIYSAVYFILMFYYITTIFSYKTPVRTIRYHQQFYDQSLTLGRRKSAERHRQLIVLIRLKQFLMLMICSHTLFAFLRLIYTCLLTSVLSFVSTPLKWSPLKYLFHSLFLISYCSIPLRMLFLMIYLFLIQFSGHLHSIFSYTFHSKLRFAWKLQKPTVCFRWQLVPYPNSGICNPGQRMTIDLTSTMDEDPTTTFVHDSVTICDENSAGHTTKVLLSADESTTIQLWFLSRLLLFSPSEGNISRTMDISVFISRRRFAEQEIECCSWEVASFVSRRDAHAIRSFEQWGQHSRLQSWKRSFPSGRLAMACLMDFRSLGSHMM